MIKRREENGKKWKERGGGTREQHRYDNRSRKSVAGKMMLPVKKACIYTHKCIHNETKFTNICWFRKLNCGLLSSFNI